MENYILSCCSTADLSSDHLKERDIPFVCFHFELDGTEYPDDMGESLTPEELYQRMAAGAATKTSQVNSAEYTQYFEPFLADGKDVLHISLSSGLSGSCNSARIAAEDLAEKYPQRKIYIVDSLGASSGYGLLMDTLADLRDAGMGLEELHQWAEENKLRLHHWFFSTDLSFYVKGGRISKTAGMIGTVLNICPLLNVSHEGKLMPREKIRGKKAVIKRIVQQMQAHAQDGQAYSGKCYICHSVCMEDAKTVAALVEGAFPQLCEPVKIFPIGATIGSHTGPGTIALFFWGDARQN